MGARCHAARSARTSESAPPGAPVGGLRLERLVGEPFRRRNSPSSRSPRSRFAREGTGPRARLRGRGRGPAQGRQQQFRRGAPSSEQSARGSSLWQVHATPSITQSHCPVRRLHRAVRTAPRPPGRSTNPTVANPHTESASGVCVGHGHAVRPSAPRAQRRARSAAGRWQIEIVVTLPPASTSSVGHAGAEPSTATLGGATSGVASALGASSSDRAPHAARDHVHQSTRNRLISTAYHVDLARHGRSAGRMGRR